MEISAALSLFKAKELCTAYQQLAGKQVWRHGIPYTIECITIGPFDDINKWIFLRQYKEYRCPEQALAFYHVPYYDVLLILRNDAFYDCMTLKDYLGQKPVNANEERKDQAMS